MKTVCVLALLLSGCVSGPKTEKKSALNYLNGDHYSVAPGINNIGGIPMNLERKAVSTKIRGQLMLNDLAPIPFKFQTLQLLSKGKKVSETQSDKDGNFSFIGNFANGAYEIVLVSKKYIGKTAIDVKEYEVRDLIILAQPNPLNP